MDVTGLTDKEIQERVRNAYFLFLELEKELSQQMEPEEAKEVAKNLIKDEIIKQDKCKEKII
jgi:hypothetical protein